MKNYSESELRKIISNYEEHRLKTIKNALLELKDRGGSIGSGFLENVAKHFKLINVEQLFVAENTEEYIIAENTEEYTIAENKIINIEEEFRNDVSKVFEKFRDGFGMILFSVLASLTISLLFFLFIVVFKNDVSKGGGIIFIFLYLIFAFTGLAGLITLYASSKIKKNG
jgi:hypothetical protein